MLSAATLKLLESIRSRFGVELEILDNDLRSVYTSGSATLTRFVRQTVETANPAAGVLSEKSRHWFEANGIGCWLFAVREGPSRSIGLASVGFPGGDRSETARWADLLEAIITADLSTSRELERERDLNRRWTGCLRFMQHLAELESIPEIIEAVIQSAAIWFDADARVYSRGFEADYILRACLPGIPAEERSARITEKQLALEADLVAEPGADPASLPGTTAMVTVRLRGRSEDSDWIMRVTGRLESDARLILDTIARVAGLRIEEIERRQANELKARFEQLVLEGGVLERFAGLLLRDLLLVSGGTSGSLTLHGPNGDRSLAAVGSRGGQRLSRRGDHFLIGTTAIAYPLSLSGGLTVTLEMRTAPDRRFGRDALIALRVIAPMLRVCLTAAAPGIVASDLIPPSAPEARFERRIAEEMARARRFGIALGLVLVEVADARRAGYLENAMRGELRGSDVLGMLSDKQVVALLTHTDGPALERVAQRLRVRLAAAAEELNVRNLTFGRAAFSAECATPEAFVAAALTGSEQIVLH